MSDYIVERETGEGWETRYLQWNDNLPDKSGWYWVWIHHQNTEAASMLYVNEKLQYHDTLPYDDEGIWRPIAEFCRPLNCSWMGPLTYPGPPESTG